MFKIYQERLEYGHDPLGFITPTMSFVRSMSVAWPHRYYCLVLPEYGLGKSNSLAKVIGTYLRKKRKDVQDIF